MSESSSLVYQGLPIEYHAPTGCICLTDLWQAQCAATRQRPLAWVRLEPTQKILKRLAQQTGTEPLYSEWQRQGQAPAQLIVALPNLLETTEVDGNLRTYAIAELAIVYARYLSPECYEWALVNVAEGNWAENELAGGGLAAQRVRQQPRVESSAQPKAMTRRAVIAAGWTIPVVTTLGLSQRVAAQVSAGHTDTPHSDHGDTAHADVAHADTAHVDVAHADVAPIAGLPHVDIPHSDTHSDTAHADTAHVDS